MKLIFPNGEHEPVTLSEGITAIVTGTWMIVVYALLYGNGIDPNVRRKSAVPSSA